MSTLIIYEQLDPPARLPFRIAEVFFSIDGGYRTRMTHKCFGTYEEAQEFVASAEGDDK